MRRSWIAAGVLALAGCTVAPVSLEGRFCAGSVDCITGYFCEASVCIPRPDAESTVDASRPPRDASRNDAGTADAAVDAPAMDAAADAGAVDAGGVDAGDTGAVDTGGIDAGAIDAGVDLDTGIAATLDVGIDVGP